MSDTTAGNLPSLWKDGVFHQDDWAMLEEGVAYGGENKVFVPFEQAITVLQSGSDLPDYFGVLVAPDDEVEALASHLDKIYAIAVSFPSFADGRGFSSARLLKERLGFEGEVRAVGAFILDQMPFLERCGVDSFAISSDKVRAGLERGEWPEVNHYYQPVGADGDATIASRPWLRRKTG